MSRDHDHQQWQAIQHAARPTPEELASAERELQDLEADPLSPAEVEELLARARHARLLQSTAPPTTPPGRLWRNTGRHRQRGIARRTLLSAATLIILISGVAMVGGRVIWPSTPPLMLTTEWQDAIAHTRSPSSAQDTWAVGIALLDGHCADGLATLNHLRSDAAAQIRRAAETALARLTAGETPPPSGATSGMAAAATSASDASLAEADRLTAMQRLEELIAAGAAAISDADASTIQRAEVKQIYVQQLANDLGR